MKDIIVKNGTYSQIGTGLSFSKTFAKFAIALGLARPVDYKTNTCCLLQVKFPQLSSDEYTAWTNSFVDHDVAKEDRRGETIFNLATQKLVCATWNGTAWVFTNLF